MIDKESLLSGNAGWSDCGHQAGGEVMLAREDKLGAEEDGDCVGSEVCFTAGITQSANREQGLATEDGEQVCNWGCCREVRDVVVSHVR
jgi:hypothetical protein